jgi:hypothetical protein
MPNFDDLLGIEHMRKIFVRWNARFRGVLMKCNPRTAAMMKTWGSSLKVTECPGIVPHRAAQSRVEF